MQSKQKTWRHASNPPATFAVSRHIVQSIASGLLVSAATEHAAAAAAESGSAAAGTADEEEDDDEDEDIDLSLVNYIA